MDSLTEEREIIRRCLRQFVGIRYANGDITNEVVFDEENARYLVVSHGWMGHRRTHGCLIHVEILGDKIWIQRDGTEDGIAHELVAAGVPKSRIVLGFHEPEDRQLGEFAPA